MRELRLTLLLLCGLTVPIGTAGALDVDLFTNQDFRIWGIDREDHMRIATLADVNGDGIQDLVAGVPRVVVVMEHTAKGKPKLLKECSLPLTGTHVVDLVITDLDLPDMSGWQLARQIRERYPDAMVGLVTGWPLGANADELAEEIKSLRQEIATLRQGIRVAAEAGEAKKK